MLVAAEVERADGHGAVGRRLDDLAVGRELLLLVGDAGVRQVQVFGAVQADAGRAGVGGDDGVGGAADVGEQFDDRSRRG